MGDGRWEMGDGRWEMDDDDKTYTKKYARNQTRAATATRTLKGIEPRDRCHRQIRVQIVKKKCTCGLCLTGDYSNIPLGECHLSFRNIANDCNELGIPSKKGKVGTWQRNQVKRILFGNQKIYPLEMSMDLNRRETYVFIPLIILTL